MKGRRRKKKKKRGKIPEEMAAQQRLWNTYVSEQKAKGSPVVLAICHGRKHGNLRTDQSRVFLVDIDSSADLDIVDTVLDSPQH